jgi:phosphonate transport system permease protein
MTITVAPPELTQFSELEHRRSGHGAGGRDGGRDGRRAGRRHRAPDRRWFVLLAAIGVWSFWDAFRTQDLFNPGGWNQVAKFFAASPHPETSPEFLRVVAEAAAITASYALVGTALSLVIGVVGGVLTSETWWRRDPLAPPRRLTLPTGWASTRFVAAMPRGMHEAVWGLVLLKVLGLDPWVAVLAIAIPFGAITAKVVAETIDDSGGDAYRAYRSSGAGRLSSLCYGIAPTIVPDVVSYGLYRLECSIRSSVVMGMIGAGGLGYQLAVSFQSLRYEQIWTLLAALVAMSAAADWWSASLRNRPSRRRIAVSAGAASLATVLAVLKLRLDPATLVSDRAQRLGTQLMRDGFPPRLPAGGWRTLLSATLDTMQLSVIAISVATVVAVPLAFVAARSTGRTASIDRSWIRRGAGFVVRSLLLFLRALPPPVWALLVLFVVFPGPLAGGIALAVYTIGVLARLDAEALENADPAPRAALRTAGAPTLPSMAYGSLPLVAPRFVSLSMYRWEVATRETVIVGLVGAGGLGRLLAQQNAAFDEAAMLTTIITLIAVSLTIDLISARVRAAVR